MLCMQYEVGGRNAFSISVEKSYLWTRKGIKMLHMSLRNGGPVNKQSFRLGCDWDERQLQSNTILMGVVDDCFLTGW